MLDGKSPGYIGICEVGLVYDLETTGTSIKVSVVSPLIATAVDDLNSSSPKLHGWMSCEPPNFEPISLDQSEGTFGFGSCGKYSLSDGVYGLTMEIEIPVGPLSPVWSGIHVLNTFAAIFSGLRFVEAPEGSIYFQVCSIDVLGITDGHRRQIGFLATTSHKFAQWIATCPDTNQALVHMQNALERIRNHPLQSWEKDLRIDVGSGSLQIVHSLFDGTGSIGTMGGEWCEEEQVEYPTGLKLSSHNLDTVEQAIVILVGLASLWQHFRQQTNKVGP